MPPTGFASLTWITVTPFVTAAPLEHPATADVAAMTATNAAKRMRFRIREPPLKNQFTRLEAARDGHAEASGGARGPAADSNAAAEASPARRGAAIWTRAG